MIIDAKQHYGSMVYKIHRIKYNDFMFFESINIERINKEKKMKLSDQAVGALMMALQKSLLEQSDIVPVLKNFELELMDDGELLVKNPPQVKAPHVKVKPKIYTGNEDA